MPEPTLAGHVTLPFLVIGLPFAVSLRNNALLLAVCALLATLVLSYFWTWFAVGKLSIERRMPSRVTSGEQFEVRLRVTNQSRWRPAFGVGFRDALQIDDPGEVTCGPSLAMLAPGATVELVYQKRIHRRGLFTVSHALAATRFPLGVFEHRVLLDAPNRIAVLPPLGRLQRSAQRAIAGPAAENSSAAARRPGQEEFDSMREYRSGDSTRLIHWRTSARAQTLVRRVLREQTQKDLVVVLDRRLAQHAETRHFESAVSCAATLLVHAQREQRNAHVHFVGGRAAHRGTHATLINALEELAGITEIKEAPNAALRAARAAGARDVVLVTAGETLEDVDTHGLRVHLWDSASSEFAKVFSRR